MTTLAPSPELGASDPIPSSAGGARVDRTFRAVAFAAGLLVLAILALIAYTTAKNAWPAFTHQGASFVTSRNWNPNVDSFGALAFVYGTMFTSVIALVLAIPASLGIALFITELAPKRVRMWVTYVVDLLAAIPSVVYGYWALAVLTQPAGRFYTNIADSIGRVPVFSSLFGGPAHGASFMTAGLILAVMIIPIITSLSREALMTVSQDDKNGAIAMGATRFEMLRVAVFPRVRSGLIGAAMLGLGRAMGETIAVALVIGSSPKITSHLFRSGDTMASVIAHNFPEATGLHHAALIGLGVVLFAITIVVNVIARGVANRSTAMNANA
ncbi:MAG TPA: phosphate ABC transporter permease subunit PstC [Acidimicrobiia bacterium]|jgi:phosphate transport system permease protein|nr:phosphate ABC transporter permease subunit PstC [Acidimicrobiia bacterium]